MMESDADRLTTIQSLGGVCVRARDSQFWALFDNDFSLIDTGVRVESRAPALTCRSCDVSSGVKDDVLRVGSSQYRIKSLHPDVPAPGWTAVLLKV